MILIIDNYDSFVHNIARFFERAGEECTVMRNDAITVKQAEKMNPAAIVISPGPCTPKEAGVSVALIQKLGLYIPTLGICLGHQCIGEAFGGRTVRTMPMHGKASPITHDGKGLFADLPETFEVGRYHSLITQLPPDAPLLVTARGPDDEIMAMSHSNHPIYGVQFHPESIMTEYGAEMIQNFIALTRKRSRMRKLAA